MENGNPYRPPQSLSPIHGVGRPEFDWCACLSLPFAATVPMLLALCYFVPIGLQPPLLDVLTVVVFAVTLLSIPLSIAGLFSRAKKLAMPALVIGCVFAVLVYVVKFHPVLMQAIR